MDGHQWEWVSESEVRATGARTKTQSLWQCPRCGQSTIIDGKVQPEATRELYAMEPQELDGTTVMEPLIGTCDQELFKLVLRAVRDS